jgi:predicted ABC-type ATPase
MSDLTFDSQDKTIWLIGGPNGPGKSSLIRVLRETIPEIELLDADHFQKSYGSPQLASFKAGRELLHRVDESINQGASFIWESTLSGAGKA